MKSIIYAALILLTAISAKAQTIINASGSQECHAQVRDLKVEREGSNFYLSFTLDLSDLKVKSEEQAVITPVLLDSVNRVTLPGAIVSGRNRYIRDQRQGFNPYGYTLFRAGASGSHPVESRIPFEDWMQEARLVLTDTITGCNCRPVDARECLIATFDMRPRIFAPEYLYMTPVAEVEKIRHADGHAYIDFPVNKTEIYPDYRRNPIELASIRDTIEIIKNDPDYSITALTLKGYASPEGSYANNERLAQGRTEALRQYIRKLYDFPASILHSEWQAEDWDGLVAYLKTCDLPARDAILAIIENPANAADLDRREWLIKSKYPADYRILLADVYPGLRHTDYTVRYTVKSYTTIEELRRAWEQDPRKLSLNELYKLALSMEQGSPEYIDVFETAARLYPDSPEACLNAAIPALQSGDLDRAARYLDRAGDSSEAVYARAILAAKRGDFDAARPLMLKAVDRGVAPATDALNQIDEIIKHSK